MVLGLAILCMWFVGGLTIVMTMRELGAKTISGSIVLKEIGLIALFSLPLIGWQIFLHFVTKN